MCPTLTRELIRGVSCGLSVLHFVAFLQLRQHPPELKTVDIVLPA